MALSLSAGVSTNPTEWGQVSCPKPLHQCYAVSGTDLRRALYQDFTVGPDYKGPHVKWPLTLDNVHQVCVPPRTSWDALPAGRINAFCLLRSAIESPERMVTQ
eukprot:2611275-Rhodomonas_salina.1